MTISDILIGIGALVLLLILAKVLLILLPIGLLLGVGVVPFLLTAAGLISAIRSNKPANTKLLWIILIVVAPVIGPLLWFLWGKKNT